MKKGFRWVWLFIGVIAISASCGFGYEAKVTRNKFEEAKDAFRNQDWDRVTDNLTPSFRNPSPKVYASFLRTYLDPELLLGKHPFEHRAWKSSFIFVDNEDVFFGPRTSNWPPPVTLRYSDQVAWFSLPISKQRYGIFQNKRISMNFFACLAKISWDRYPQNSQRDQWKAILAFINAEKVRLTEIGIAPKHLGSNKKSWEEFSKEFETIFRKGPASRGT